MRTLVIGDIHSGLKALQQVLKTAAVTPEDTLIFLGDYVDGWSDAAETVAFLMQLKETHNCIFIRGNHDVLCYDWLTKKAHNAVWLQHGGSATATSYDALAKEDLELHLSFYRELKNYYIDADNRIFLHAGYTHLRGVENEYFEALCYWDRTLWELALCIDPSLTPKSSNYPERLKQYKEIYIGHTPVTRIGETTPQNRANVWNIDTGAAFKGPLTIFDADTKEYWQSDPVFTHYRNETGRN